MCRLEVIDLRQHQWGAKDSFHTTAGMINDEQEEWYCLKIQGVAGLVPLPFTAYDTLVLGRWSPVEKKQGCGGARREGSVKLEDLQLTWREDDPHKRVRMVCRHRRDLAATTAA